MTSERFADTPAGRRLVRAGLMDEETGATRKAKAARCGKCNRVIMRGLDSDFGSRLVEADPEPLTALGETLALLSGRGTVSLRWLGDRYEMHRRDHFHIRGSPAGTNGIDVLVIHDCALAVGFPLPGRESTLRDDIPVNHSPDKPPF